MKSLAPAVAPRAALSPHAASPQTMLLVGIGFCLTLMAPSLIGLLTDARQINGINVWIKPVKFQASSALTLLTLLWLLPLAGGQIRSGRLLRIGVSAAAVMSVFEVAYITLQAARGRPSHFNEATLPEHLGFALMGVGALGLVTGVFLVGLVIWRSPVQQGRGGLHLGAALGLMAGAVLTVLTAGILSAHSSHWVGGVASDAGGLPLVGWSTTGGDLRVAHFFATHLMQALPVLGLLADRLAPQRARQVVRAGTVAGVLVVVAVFLQALAGRPFWS